MLCFLFLCSLFSLGNADVFTAIADLQNMLGAERNIAPVIQEYIEVESKRLERLRKLSEHYFTHNSDAEQSAPEYVTNPVNAFSLIKRVRSEWQQLEDGMRNNSAVHYLSNISDHRVRNEVKFPEQDDLSGAAVALMRLQDVYQLDTHELANGIIDGEKVGPALTANDCSHVGYVAYNAEDYYHALLWLQEAWNRVVKEHPPTTSETHIMEYLAYALFAQGNQRRAMDVVIKWAAMTTENNTKAQGQLAWYVDHSPDVDLFGEVPPLVNNRINLPYGNYEPVCRGEGVGPTPDQQRKLYCYHKNDRSFLKLAPIKVEIIRHDPLAVVFRGVLSDREIELIRMVATPKLARSTVLAANGTQTYTTTSYRISKNAWLKEWDHEVVARVNRRIGDMTNLNQETSEDLQVANYGLGGHYEPHYDFSRDEEKNAFQSLGAGNRIATVLFYMSQPDKGGATVFNKLGNAVFPSVHDALFWYNLKRNGKGDFRTEHAACPVLLGTKWVSNKWIHERGQEFTRPCGLDEEAFEHFVGDLNPAHRPI